MLILFIVYKRYIINYMPNLANYYSMIISVMLT